MSEKIFQWELLDGTSVAAGDMTITPQSQALSIRFPFGGFVWNRPVAVLVERNGRSERITIVDPTRLALLVLAVVSTVVTLLSWRKK